MALSNRVQQRAIKKLAIDALDDMLTFATTLDIHRSIITRQARDYDEFERLAAVLTETDRIDGKGVIASRAAMNGTGPEDFFHKDVGLSSHELGAYIDQFPLEAAAASYLFTLLEIFGNEVAALVRPGSINKNKAWHEDVSGFADLRDPVQVATARVAFAKHLGADAGDVPELAARRMVGIKRLRNDFAHDGADRLDFDGFLKNTLAVVCHVFFLTTDEERLSVYPWEDPDGVFAPLSKP